MSTVSHDISANLASDPPLGELSEIALDPSLMVPELVAGTKIPAIKELVDRLSQQAVVDDSLAFLQAVLERESLCSTVLGGGLVALPHARGRMVRRLGLALGRARQPIAFPSGDERNQVRLICLIAVPGDAPGLYLRLLAVLARTFDGADFRDRLAGADGAQQMYDLLVERLESCVS